MYCRVLSLCAIVVWLLVLSMLIGCQRPEDSRIELTQGQWSDIQSQLLDERPTPEYEMGVEFDGNIELIGVDVDGSFERGQEIELTWYWNILEDIDQDWQIFVHFDSQDSQFRQNLDHFPLGEMMNDAYRTYHFEQGHILADSHRFTLSQDYPDGEAIFYVGLFRGDERAPVTNDGSATDGHRALGPTITIDDGNDDGPHKEPTSSPVQ